MKLTRREFISAGAAAGAGLVLASCSDSAPSAVKDLDGRLTGSVLVPGDPGFATENLPANDVHESVTPKAIALCQTPEDVRACVRWSSNNLLRPAVWWRDQPSSMQRDLLDWTADTFEFISGFTQAGSFQNWPYSAQKDWQQAYYGDNFGRLRQIKQKCDPTNLFRYTQSIPV